MSERCGNCRFYVGGAAGGFCDYRVPPAVARILSMLNAEPATQIDWLGETEVPPPVKAGDHCSEWRRRIVP